MENITIWKGLFDLVLWFLIFLVLKQATVYPYKLSQSRRIVGVTLILIFCLFPFWGGDYYHYRDSYEVVRAGWINHYEEVYIWVINNLTFSYTSFRLVVWGFALSILFWAYKRIGVNYDLILFFFGAVSLLRFSYARASVAMAILILGLTFLYKPIKKGRFLSIVIGSIITCSAVFFHRSSVIGIAAIAISFFLINNSKWKVFAIALAIPFLSAIVSYMLSGILDMSFESYDAVLENKIENYLANEEAQRGIAVKIINFTMQVAMYISAFSYLYLVLNGSYNRFSQIEKALASYLFVVMMISIGLSLDLTHETSIISTRTSFYAMPANAVFLMSMKSHGTNTKLFKLAYYFGIAYVLFSLLYSTYMGYNRM